MGGVDYFFRNDIADVLNGAVSAGKDRETLKFLAIVFGLGVEEYVENGEPVLRFFRKELR